MGNDKIGNKNINK